ncbi:MAG: O-antigen ligase family protein [Pseudomonadota bacterium]
MSSVDMPQPGFSTSQALALAFVAFSSIPAGIPLIGLYWTPGLVLGLTLTALLGIQILQGQVIDALGHRATGCLAATLLGITVATLASPLDEVAMLPVLRLAIVLASSFYVAQSLATSQRGRAALAVAFICHALLHITYQLLFNPRTFAETGRFPGDNMVASTLIYCLPLLAFAPIQSAGRLTILGTLVLVGFATYSRMFIGHVMATLALLGTILRRAGRITLTQTAVTLFLGGLLVGALYLYIDTQISDGRATSNIERLASLLSALDAFSLQPSTGLGWGGWAWRHKMEGISRTLIFFVPGGDEGNLSLNPHNGIARMLCDAGLIGTIPFLLLIGQTVYQAMRWKGDTHHMLYLQSSAAGLLIGLSLSDPLESPNFWLALVTTLAVARALHGERSEQAASLLEKGLQT